MRRVYFAYPSASRGSKTVERLKRELEYWGFEVIDPFEAVEEEYRRNYNAPSLIAYREVQLIAEADALFAYLPRHSIGVMCEILVALQIKKRVVVYTTSEKIYQHPWLRLYVMYLVKDLDMARFYLGGGKKCR